MNPHRAANMRTKRKPQASRSIGYQVVVPPSDQARVDRLLEGAVAAGVVLPGQWGGSRGHYWWNGPPGAAMRTLRDAIGGTPGWPA